jgi:hypothetical protein
VIGAAALVALVVAVLVLANWGTIRDHVEAWHFQLTRDTEELLPDPAFKGRSAALPATIVATWKPSQAPLNLYFSRGFFRFMADYSGRPVIFASGEHDYQIQLTTPHEKVTADVAKAILEGNGWRVVEQRFPRRAYVVIHCTDQSGGVVSDGRFFSPFPDTIDWYVSGKERP